MTDQPPEAENDKPPIRSRWYQNLPLVVFIAVAIIAILPGAYALHLMNTTAPEYRLLLGPMAYATETTAHLETTIRATEQINQYLALLQTATAVLVFAGAVLGLLGLGNLYRLGRLSDRVAEQVDKANEIKRNYEQLQEALTAAKALQQTLQGQIRTTTRSLSLVQLGMRQVELSNFDMALKYFSQADELDSGNGVIRYFIGDIYLRRGDYSQGIRYLEPVATSGDLPAKASLAYAWRLQADAGKSEQSRKKDYIKAERLFCEVFEENDALLDVSGECAFGALAGLYKRTGQYQKARDFYDHCAQITPHKSYPVNNLALLYYCYAADLDLEHDQDARSKALAYFEQSRKKAAYAINLSSNDYWHFFDLLTAELALEKSTITQLQEHIREAADRQPVPQDWDKLLEGIKSLRQANPAIQHIDAISEEIEVVKRNSQNRS